MFPQNFNTRKLGEITVFQTAHSTTTLPKITLHTLMLFHLHSYPDSHNRHLPAEKLCPNFLFVIFQSPEKCYDDLKDHPFRSSKFFKKLTFLTQ